MKEWIQVKRVISKADVVLEVLDARDPYRTRCRKIEELAKKLGKKVVLVINKADLVPREVLEKWKFVFQKEYPTIYISAKERLGTRKLWVVIKKVTNKRPVTVAVVGYPNVGKSMIINYLKGRHSVGTSPIPGFTRHTTLVKAATWLKVIDTPGVIPVEKDASAVDLVVKGAIRPEELDDPIPYAVEFIEEALKKDIDVFKKTYGIKEKEPLKILEELAKKRGLFLRGGKLNIEEAARIVIRDWQRGELVFYFTPEDYGLT